MVCVPWKLLAVNLAAKVTDAPDKQLQLFVWLAILALLPVVAAVSYHLVEHPARKALRGLAQRSKTASSDKTPDVGTSKRVSQS
jgi:peptidoglycan/LPS O-acetylase OafA/YrhL